MSLLAIVLLPLLGACLPPLLALTGQKRLVGVGTAAVVVAAGLLLVRELPAVFGGQVPALQLAWIPSLGVAIDLHLDGLAALFAILVLGIGLLVVIYAYFYLSAKESAGQFFAYLLLFMGAMLGVVLSANLVLMVVFWELTSLSSFLLIGYKHGKMESRRGARTALTITGMGGLALLAGVLLLGDMVGSYRLVDVLAAHDRIVAHPLYIPMLLLVLLGAFTKSAQVPFHFWLPGAMAAPTPVSAYLHSATMVKAGVFLLARLYPALSGTDAWFYLVCGGGLVTLVFGAYAAMFKHDLKALLAYSTISHLGLITLLFGMDTRLSAVAAVFHIINHATFKASLFMAAGIVDLRTGTRDIRILGGLRKHMPWTATLATVAGAAMAGVPLLNGFLSKEMFFAETFHTEQLGRFWWALPVLATLAGVLSVSYSLRFVRDVFYTVETGKLPQKPLKKIPRGLRLPVEFLVVACVVVGVLPAFTVAPLLQVASTAVLQGTPPEYSLAIWHGFNLPLVMSLIALVLGVFTYRWRRRILAIHDRLLPEVRVADIFDVAVRTAFNIADRALRLLQTDRLQASVFWFVLAVVVVGALGLWLPGTPLFGPSSWQKPLLPLDPLTILGAVVIAVSAVATCIWHRQRLVVLVLLGVLGLMNALAFVRYAAPDLALTQLSVEVVTVILLVLALFFLPPVGSADSSNARRVRDVVLAGAAGLGTAVVALAFLTRRVPTISGYFMDNSLPKGGGTNVVNVILVDFRGYDTMGEVMVLVVAAVIIGVLLGGRHIPGPSTDGDGRRWSTYRHPLQLAVLTRPLLPTALLVALYIFGRGHNTPGGGFVAGLVAGVAIIVQFLANGVRWAKPRLFFPVAPTLGLGLLFVLVTGLTAVALGAPFLTSAFGHVHWPVLGEFELASAMAFDLGVFLAVVGVILSVLLDIGALANAPAAGTTPAAAVSSTPPAPTLAGTSAGKSAGTSAARPQGGG